jgi:ketosteroid isomerase-like protein
MVANHAPFLAIALSIAAPPQVAAMPCTSTAVKPLPASLRAEVARQNTSLAAARASGNVDALIAHFAPDSVFMPEHQPRLFGRDQGAAYYRAFAARLPVESFTSLTADLLPLDDGALEWGTFKVAYRDPGPDRAAALDGKYIHVWRRQPDGTLKLKAEVWGYLRPLDDPSSHWFAEIPRGNMPAQKPDPGLAAELAELNAANARSVQNHDTARVDQYAEDAVYLPFAEKPQVGLAALRSHLIPYIEQGRGATFENVTVGNDGFEVVDGYVIEYSKFAVRWRAGQAMGVTSGGGLRLWRREADCALKIVRQIGTHDYRP